MSNPPRVTHTRVVRKILSPEERQERRARNFSKARAYLLQNYEDAANQLNSRDALLALKYIVKLEKMAAKTDLFAALCIREHYNNHQNEIGKILLQHVMNGKKEQVKDFMKDIEAGRPAELLKWQKRNQIWDFVRKGINSKIIKTAERSTRPVQRFVGLQRISLQLGAALCI